MVVREVTEEERKKWPREVIVPLEKAFADVRGEIQPLVDLPMESCVLISSKKGAVRANHYHRTDWHFCYVLSGSIEYSERPHGLKYSLFFGRDGRRIVAYDNERGKGDHKHIEGRESRYRFVSVEQLVADFLIDVERARKRESLRKE